MQQPTNQSVDQRKDVAGQFVPRQYLDTALVAGQYKIYCPAMAFDLPTQSVTYIYTHTVGPRLSEHLCATSMLIVFR